MKCYFSIWAIGLWTTFVVHGCNCSSLFAFYGDDANTPVRCANCTEAFLGDISHLAPISSSFSSVCMHLLHIIVMSKMKPILGWYIVFQCETGTSGNFVSVYYTISCSYCIWCVYRTVTEGESRLPCINIDEKERARGLVCNIGDLMEGGDCSWDYLKSCIKMSYCVIRRSECVKGTAYII
jgi:hypothetical protein